MVDGGNCHQENTTSRKVQQSSTLNIHQLNIKNIIQLDIIAVTLKVILIIILVTKVWQDARDVSWSCRCRCAGDLLRDCLSGVQVPNALNYVFVFVFPFLAGALSPIPWSDHLVQ